MQHTPIITKINSAINNACKEYSVHVYDNTCLDTSLYRVEDEITHLLDKKFIEKGTYKFNISATINIKDWSCNNTHNIRSDPIKVSSISINPDEPVKD